MLTGLSMRRSLRRHLAKGNLVSGDSRDQNNCGGRWGECGVCNTSKPEGIWLLLGHCDSLFADGERGSGDICGCGHSGGRKREGPMKIGRDELKYHKAYPTRRGRTSHSHSLLRISTQAHIWLIHPSISSYVHASYPIYRTGPNTPFQIPNILSTSFSDIDNTILPAILRGHVTKFQ
jgi:hypothetical protein